MSSYYYLYEGTIGVAEGGYRSIELCDINDWDKPPVALRVPCAELAKYLEARGGCDAEERYITQAWIYDRNLCLQAIWIPGDRPGIPAKVIACKDPERLSGEIVIFGPSELLAEAAASMDMDAYRDFLLYRNEYGLRPRNLTRRDT